MQEARVTQPRIAGAVRLLSPSLDSFGPGSERRGKGERAGKVTKRSGPSQ